MLMMKLISTLNLMILELWFSCCVSLLDMTIKFDVAEWLIFYEPTNPWMDQKTFTSR